MTSEQKLLKVAFKLVQALDKEAENLLPQQILEIVKLHSKLAVGAAFIPVPGLDMAGSAASIWSMYIRINQKIGIPFKENVVKSLASGVATNLAGYLAVSGAGSLIKLIPGIGTVAGAVAMTAASYAATLASGWLYLNALSLAAQKKGAAITMNDISSAMSSLFKDKGAIKEFIDTAKDEHKNKK
ncbi:MAG: DUF697 domain-containing protein [Bacteroidales bacterium]|nr:DUF697 domain-containing protein [Bacteroidales bacterium]